MSSDAGPLSVDLLVFLGGGGWARGGSGSGTKREEGRGKIFFLFPFFPLKVRIPKSLSRPIFIAESWRRPDPLILEAGNGNDGIDGIDGADVGNVGDQTNQKIVQFLFAFNFLGSASVRKPLDR